MTRPAVDKPSSNRIFGPISGRLIGSDRSLVCRGFNFGDLLTLHMLDTRMEFPASILQALNPSNTSPEAQAAGQVAINDYLTAKGKRAAGAPLTAQESATTSTPGMATLRPVNPCWSAPFNCARSWWCWPEIPITAGTATSRSRA